MKSTECQTAGTTLVSGPVLVTGDQPVTLRLRENRLLDLGSYVNETGFQTAGITPVSSPVSVLFSP